VKTYTVAVRTLCEFAAKAGDLDFRFTPSPSAQEGIAGHRAVLASRGEGYRREVTVAGEHRGLIVRGRADGYDPLRQRVEEVKTFAGAFERMPENHRALHWAQAKVYAALLCRQLGLTEMTVALVYFDVGRQREAAVLSEQHGAPALYRHFETLCDRFLAWAEREAAHRQRRDAALERLRFPYPAFRPGQRDLAKAVFNAARSGGCLLAQAPTGIGKTIATLFPMLKACPAFGLDKVLFLTAKGSGQPLALGALESLHAAEQGLELRVVELTARDKACEHPDKTCDGASCPLARGFYDRLPAAREAAAAARMLTRSVLREIARAHRVCPYFLGQEMARWCDVVIGDYNYYFDASALLSALTQSNGWRIGLLVDEAHNLPERGQAMYSASLGSAQVRSARAGAPAAVRKPLDRLLRYWHRLAAEASAAYCVLDEIPRRWTAALQDAVAAIGDLLAETPPPPADRLLQLYFDALALLRLQNDPGPHAMVDLTTVHEQAHGAHRPRRESTLCLRNVVPAHFLGPRFAQAHASVLFSATLAPTHFYIDSLGLPATSACVDVEAPFRPGQLAVRIVRNVSTRYRDRGRSLAPIASLLAAQYAREPGNYMVYLSSFEYLEQLLPAVASRHPEIPLWRQHRGMSDAERERFLQRFSVEGRGIGFAVLGGAFAEGIDLVGPRLVGVFIATLGLPQVNEVNEEMRRRLQSAYGAGYDYVYLFPGIRKVVQAAGRVIRSESDRGSVHLIDDRFARPDVLRLLPRWLMEGDGDIGGKGEEGRGKREEGRGKSTL
jgi:DNA excision repair protein ERCC-2